MDQHSLDVLEFEAIKTRLASFTCSEMGRTLCHQIVPGHDALMIKKELARVQEAKEAITIYGRLPLSGVRDIRPILTSVHQVVTGLDAPELLEIEKFLDMVQENLQWICQLADGYPSFQAFGKNLMPLQDLKENLNRCFDPSGEIKDSASPTLSRIRKEVRREKEEILRMLDGLLEKDDIIQGDYITLRNDRYVIPIKANKRHGIQGVIHDESGSGATLFIEPMVSVDAQNRYRRLRIREQEEIKRILSALSHLVSSHSDALRSNLNILSEMDFLQAKALFSQRINGVAPVIHQYPVIRLKGARHTLLIFRHFDSPEMGKEPVAIDIEINQDTRAMVISGPNTGGKTVTLKMVGLLQIMMQAGLHIPVQEGSELGIFEEILADIGDEQDITKDLSSFSSHIKNIARILEHMGPRSIVLLDELGADTNPTEGAALGIALLEYILRKGALCIVTTHHNGLKAYAASHSKIKNASMGFDPERKAPTYQLHIGYPGSSNALGICTQLGVPKEILKRAHQIMGKGEVQLEDLLLRIEQEEKQLNEELKKQFMLRKETDAIKERYRHLLSSLEEKDDRITKEAHSMVQDLVEKARKEIEKIVSEMKKSIPNRQNIKSAHEGLREVANQFKAPRRKVKRDKQVGIERISVGQPVLICDLNEKGIVSRIDQDDNKVWVMVGHLKFQVKADDIAPAQGPDHQSEKNMDSKSKRIHVTTPVSTCDVSPKLVVIGQRVEDALEEIDKYLDSAILAHLSCVSIIHGKGTGALKNAIETFLRSHPQVASYRSGSLREGGTGVTVVELAA